MQEPEVTPTGLLDRVRSIAHSVGMYGVLRAAKWVVLDPQTRSIRMPGSYARAIRNRLLRLTHATPPMRDGENDIAPVAPPPDPIVAPPPAPIVVDPPLFKTAESLTAKGHLSAAIEMLESIHPQFPNHIATLGLLASNNLRTGRYSASIKYYELLELQGIIDYESVLCRYAALLLHGRADDARIFLDRVVRTSPEVARVRVLLGFEQERQGDLAEAHRHYSLASAADPASIEALNDVTRFYTGHGQREVFVAAWKRLYHLKAQGSPTENVEVLDSTWTAAVGHMAILDSYLKAIALGIVPKKRRVLIAREGISSRSKFPYVANTKLLELFKEHIEVVDQPGEIEKYELLDPSAEVPMTILRTSGGQAEFWPLVATRAQAQWERERRPPLLRLSAQDIETGRKVLNDLGIPQHAWYATLHVRDTNNRTGDLDSFARNAEIEDYRLAVQAVADRNGYVLRLGEEGMPPVDLGPNFIDYAHTPAKTEAMDVFLVSQARFHIGTDSGMSILPGVFDVPCAYTNWSPPGTFAWYGNALYILKMLRRPDGRLIEFDEMVRSPLGSCESLYYMESHSLKLEDNTPEEIRELVAEMMDVVEGKFKPNQEDAANQAKLDRLIERVSGYGRCRLGRAFLRKHAALLPHD